MTRKITRHASFQLTLDISEENFARTPRESQRNWLLNRIMREASVELQHLDAVAPDMIKGSDTPLNMDRVDENLEDTQIMEDWQIPVMQAMAAISTRECANGKGDVLEIGFGRGVSASFIQEYKPGSHTIIECDSQICKRYDTWKKNYPHSPVRLVQGMWQNVLTQLSTYDGILFHTYPMNEQDFVDQVLKSSTFAEHFFSTAAALLRPSGVLTYLTNETDSLSREHQRALFQHFSSFRLSVINDLDIPDDSQDSLWQRKLVIVEVVK